MIWWWDKKRIMKKKISLKHMFLIVTLSIIKWVYNNFRRIILLMRMRKYKKTAAVVKKMKLNKDIILIANNFRFLKKKI